MRKCKHCGGSFSSSHYCPVASQTIDYDDDSNFLLSAVVAYETNSVLLGAMAGGDIAGAVIGEIFSDAGSGGDW
jgi:hypothetical protein